MAGPHVRRFPGTSYLAGGMAAQFGGGKDSMNGFEYTMAFLLVLVRLFLIGVVVWFVVKEIRKSGRTKK